VNREPSTLHHILTTRVEGSHRVDLKVFIVLALHSPAHSLTPLQTKTGSETPLSARASMVWIAALSALGWAVVLLPFWAAGF
jgi:hypothetical protein